MLFSATRSVCTSVYYCQISEKYTREYIISSECLPPYGILLADLTIVHNCGDCRIGENDCGERPKCLSALVY
jgi:hypothetical protein